MHSRPKRLRWVSLTLLAPQTTCGQYQIQTGTLQQLWRHKAAHTLHRLLLLVRC